MIDARPICETMKCYPYGGAGFILMFLFIALMAIGCYTDKGEN